MSLPPDLPPDEAEEEPTWRWLLADVAGVVVPELSLLLQAVAATRASASASRASSSPVSGPSVIPTALTFDLR